MPDLFVAKAKNNHKKDPIPNPDAKPYLETETKLKKVPMLTAFVEHPNNLHFEHQEPNEVIHLFLRRHFITNLRWAIGSIFGALLPLLLLFILPYADALNLTIPTNYQLIIVLFYYLILIGYFFINFITWYYNVGIVTNMRVVDIDIAYITSKNVAATGLSDIVDVEYSQSGFMQNLFDYGNVHMQTEGLKANFEFLNVPKPAKTTDIISDLMREARNE